MGFTLDASCVAPVPSAQGNGRGFHSLTQHSALAHGAPGERGFAVRRSLVRPDDGLKWSVRL